MSKTKRSAKTTKISKPLQVGFLPENDCAPLVVAHELGLFEDYGLSVQLSRESSCATLRDRIMSGRLDAAHAPASLPFALTMGLDFEQSYCISGLVLSLQGNAITISKKLWEEGVHDADTLRQRIFADWGRRTYTFGVVFPYSPQYFLLCQWLRSAGIVPHSHVRIVVIPSEQMFPTLELGYLDGFCVGEPWTSVAVDAGVGKCLISSAHLAPAHPEKALLVRQEFAVEYTDEHLRLIAALREACEYCDQPGNRARICKMLAAPEYVNAPAECIRHGMIGPFTSPEWQDTVSGLNVFSHHHANDPSNAKVTWITKHLTHFLYPSGKKSSRLSLLDHIYRHDIYVESQKFLRKSGGVKTKSAGRALPLLAEPLCANA